MDEERLNDRISSAYFTEVGRFDLPTRDEEVRLFTAYAKARAAEARAAKRGLQDERARHGREKGALAGRIAEGYLRFVIKQARRRTRDQTLFKELISAGNVGLMEAVERFDVTRGFKFLTYGAWWINVYMQELLNRTDTVHVPNHTRKDLRRRKREEEVLMALGRVSSQSQIEEPSVGLLDPNLADDADTEAPAMAHECDVLRYMADAGLTLRARLILAHTYGLRDSPPKSLSELSQLFYELDGSYLPTDRLKKMKEEAMAALRDHLEDQGVEAASALV